MGEHRSAKTKWQVLIVDDHPLVRAGLAALIAGEPDLEVCGEAGGIGEALEMVRARVPDLAVVDLSLADGNGLELVKRLKAGWAKVRTLVCSMHEESLFARRVLDAGAMGYINKQEAMSHVVEAVRQVLAGKVYLSAAMTERIAQGPPGAKEAADGSPLGGLTDRELEVFTLIGQGLTPARIAERLHRSVKTVDAHRENIKRKLDLPSATELTRYAVLWTLEQRGEGVQR
jgi:DNA-binding NarL/FixJ family response regulator